MPRMSSATCSKASDGVIMHVPKARSAMPEAIIIERRSPYRSATAAAGTSPITRPTPSNDSVKAAAPVDAPKSIAVVTRIGITAPLPIS